MLYATNVKRIIVISNEYVVNVNYYYIFLFISYPGLAYLHDGKSLKRGVNEENSVVLKLFIYFDGIEI